MEVGAPATVVFDVISSAELLPSWNTAVARIRRLETGPVQVGQRAVVVGRLFGQEMESETQVVAFDRPRLFATRAIRGPSMHTRFALEPFAYGTRLSIQVEGEPPGGALGGMVARGVLRRELGRSMERLRALCEERARRTATAEPLEGGDAACWLGEIPGTQSPHGAESAQRPSRPAG